MSPLAPWRPIRVISGPLADRTPAEIKALIAKLDEVCRQAIELQKTLRLQMLDRSRRERLYERSAKLTRKKPPR